MKNLIFITLIVIAASIGIKVSKSVANTVEQAQSQHMAAVDKVLSQME